MMECKILEFELEKRKLLEKRDKRLREEVDEYCEMFGIHYADILSEEEKKNK